MQEVLGRDGGIDYAFIYMETYNLILVWKDGKLWYELDTTKKELTCNCPGNRRWQHCKHVDFVMENFDFSRVVKPRGWLNKINEEYIANYLTIRKHGWRGGDT